MPVIAENSDFLLDLKVVLRKKLLVESADNIDPELKCITIPMSGYCMVDFQSEMT